MSRGFRPTWILLGWVAVFFLPLARGQDPDLVLYHSSAIVGMGGQAELTITLDNQAGDIQAWSWGVCHDPALVSLLAVEMSEFVSTVNDGDPPDFHQIETFPDGWTLGVVISAFGCCTIPPGNGYEMYHTTYEAGSTIGTASVEFCETLGAPPVSIVIVIGGASILPVTGNGTIEILEEAPFARGDCNQDGALDLADVIFSELYMFAGGETPGCLDACDSNDDGVMNIADPIYLLNLLFIQGPPLPTPSESCGSDPTDDGLSCESFGAGVCP